jgi:glycosyltransferase involved in cell wall biosynthesis
LKTTGTDPYRQCAFALWPIGKALLPLSVLSGYIRRKEIIIVRIVHVVQGMPPESLGGTEMYAAHLSHALRHRGHEVHIFTRMADPQRPEYVVETVSADGLPVTRVNNPFIRLNTFAQSYLNPDVAQCFGTFLDAVAPEIVHFHHLMYLSTTCVEEAARRRIPVVMTLHDYWLICQRGRFLKPDLSVCSGQTDAGCACCFGHLLSGKLTPLYQKLKPAPGKHRWLRDWLRWGYAKYVIHHRPSAEACLQIAQRMAHIRETCRAVSLFLAPSQFLRGQFLAFGIPPEKIIFAECGLPAMALQNGRKRQSDDPIIFGYIGVIDPVKGIHHLVEAVAPLTKAELRIYGGETDYAPYPNRAQFLAQLRHSSHIRMMGRYDNHELGRILSEVDVVVVPSIWYENAPLVIREAFLARKPVVTAAFGGMQEWVDDGVNGLLFHPRDVADLRRTLARFIADPTLVEKLSGHFPPVRSIADDAAAMEVHYQSLVNIVP